MQRDKHSEASERFTCFLKRSVFLHFAKVSIIVIILLIAVSTYTNKTEIPSIFEKHFRIPLSDNNPFDYCTYVYIDMGTNTGVQIRKLYEPHLYPNAPVLPLFQRIFDNRTNQVCSIGFEANPVHDSYLKEFEDYCHKRGWRVKIFTSTAVSTKDGNVTFYTEAGNDYNNQWGASLSDGKGKVPVTVRSINIASWITKNILTRKLHNETLPPKLMLKSDIEGHDMAVLANFILTGVFCSFDIIYGEHISTDFIRSVKFLKDMSGLCNTELILLDDETFHRSRHPFLIPKSTSQL